MELRHVIVMNVFIIWHLLKGLNVTWQKFLRKMKHNHITLNSWYFTFTLLWIIFWGQSYGSSVIFIRKLNDRNFSHEISASAIFLKLWKKDLMGPVLAYGGGERATGGLKTGCVVVNLFIYTWLLANSNPIWRTFTLWQYFSDKISQRLCYVPPAAKRTS